MKRETLTMGWRGKCEAVADLVFVDKTPVAPNQVAPVVRAVAVGPWTAPDPLELCLELWKAWMGSDSDRDMGVKTMGGLAGDGGGYDIHEAQHASDNRIAAATDAMIDSLKTVHRWAIYASCGVGTPWRFAGADLALVSLEAKAELGVKLKKNICTATLF
ncbi:hypothetical protein [Rugamonas sp. DEMB1]|uniref:hypothetical protein n=1 Tax=Rugamonas sp. DEMB1 TaxID=3039386 RepID=UPI00244C69BC|nr:hypothetical protein [Rugamonas sp. DEMB1]WGG51815.1 hypothetical protein QC826_06235 [Rugamonas sp. DEMB1]